MDTPRGFIHTTREIKLLILFVLSRLPLPIDAESLADLVLVDGGFNYFDYKQCLYELELNDNVKCKDNRYSATTKGAYNCSVVEDSLPYSVRQRALKAMKPVIKRMERDALLIARHTPLAKGGFQVELAVSDEMGELMSMKLFAAEEEIAEKIEKNFREKAEQFYADFMEQMMK